MNKKFDDPSNHWDFISKDHLHHKTLNIMPDHDLIAMIDSQAGLVQQMRCMHESPACHSLELTMCELLTQCGDPRHRFSGCSVKLEPARLVQALLDFIRPVLLPMTCLLVMQMALVWLLRFTYIRMKEQGADGLDFGYGQSR
ncbi:hypothetical protein SARC_12404 [Sphaeroforma arctica JP610]|uniref:Uncharacterized protein n=1 Tax=Sphaeroforma arctica JP610 TaxID=667725 RepID=A0A0L0FEA6_9EUKA|nr:hypothetical protein SARC_12404 [Sphaeroforma arctica JP610]KNC75065.1 hypothetical protein SARC_12404 [Sphaeroforma arctica JP610]|eukprot:XP_014148967.1 hypothetical protein SARC_12404 [Sphaeroforma arctica JP610]